MKKSNHQFALILSGVSEITSALADGLYEATGGDIEFTMSSGVASLEFNRSAPSLREAIVSAIRQVENAKLGIRVVRVDSPSSNTIAKINADLLETSVG